MKCPSCSREVNEDKKYCDFCGASLFGPRSINLNNMTGRNTIGTKNVGPVQSNNIKSITGIDINEIAPVLPPEPAKKENVFTKFATNNKFNKKTLKIILIVFFLLVTLGVCVYLLVDNINMRNNQKVCEAVSNVDGYYSMTNNYTFLIPKEYAYQSSGSELVLYNNKITITVYNTRKGQIDKISAASMKDNYSALGYAVDVEESVLNQRKIMYVHFGYNNVNFTDFYYQYDSDQIIFGQIASEDKNYINKDIKQIISSFKIRPSEETFIEYNAPVNYNRILSALN